MEVNIGARKIWAAACDLHSCKSGNVHWGSIFLLLKVIGRTRCLLAYRANSFVPAWKIILRWGKFSPFFCLEFLCFLGKAIRKLVRKATLVASRILRFPWLNPSGFSPKYSRQAALLALINYIFQMIDQGTVMYTNNFWSHLTLDSVAFWVVVTVRFAPIVVDYLFISTLKKN